MQEKTFILYYLVLAACTAIATRWYWRVDKAMRIFVVLLCITSISELASYILLKTENYNTKAVLFHISPVVELVLLTRYFLLVLKPHHHAKLQRLNYMIWPAFGIINIVFLQPAHKFNSNMLMLESFSIITMSLYTIYMLLKNDEHIFGHVHFWIAVLLLVFWSCTFFFWAFIQVLYTNEWMHIGPVLILHIVINTIVYAGIAAVLLLYPKMKNIENN